MTRSWTPEEKAKACAEILVRVTGGKSLLSACANGDDWTPTESTFRDWCNADSVLAANYTSAREARSERIFEECLTIADSQEADVYLDAEGSEQTNHDVIARAKLRIDTRKWMLGKMQPKVYGDKLAIGGADDLPPVKHEISAADILGAKLDAIASRTIGKTEPE